MQGPGRGDSRLEQGTGDMSVPGWWGDDPGPLPGHRWWQLCHPGVMCSTRLQWHQAAGREVTLRGCRVAGTDGTADVELVQGAGGSARGGEVTLPSHKLSLACQRSGAWQQVAAGDREVTLHQGRGHIWGQGGDAELAWGHIWRQGGDTKAMQGHSWGQESNAELAQRMHVGTGGDTELEGDAELA